MHDDMETESIHYGLPHIGVVFTFDGFVMQFTPTRERFDDLRTPMQTAIIKALLTGALRLVEDDSHD